MKKSSLIKTHQLFIIIILINEKNRMFDLPSNLIEEINMKEIASIVINFSLLSILSLYRKLY